MKWTADDWARLGKLLRAERERQGLSRRALSETSGVSDGTIQNTEEGRIPTRWPQSLGSIERALGWAPGSTEAILDGGDPAPATPSTPARSASPEPLAFERDAARGGALLAAQQVREASDRILDRLCKDETDIAVAAARLVTLAASLAQHAAVLQVVHDIPSQEP